MNNVIEGQIIVLGKNIDTDQIYPGRYLAITDPKEIGSLCLSGVDPNIAKNFKKGSIIVAGTNFGCGSSREHAPISILNMGASAVVAESFARIFYRNAINLGLPLIICKDIRSKVKENQTLKVNISEGYIEILETSEIFVCEKIGDHAYNILEAGGIKPIMKQKFKKE